MGGIPFGQFRYDRGLLVQCVVWQFEFLSSHHACFIIYLVWYLKMESDLFFWLILFKSSFCFVQYNTGLLVRTHFQFHILILEMNFVKPNLEASPFCL